MTRAQEYQITVCFRELRNGATPAQLISEGCAAKAVELAAERAKAYA